MLKIHKPFSKKCKLLTICITSICITSSLLGISFLTYTPELLHAEMVDNIEHRTILDVDYMQEVLPEICSNSKEGDAKRLTDSRDGKKYWVSKMRDGNCWMNQNLAYAPSDANLVTTWPSGYKLSLYRNPGSYVYSTPTEKTECTTTTDFAPCSKWVNIDGWQASDDVDFRGVVDSENKIYDAHYLAGYYYSWVAATANSAPDLSEDNKNAPASICPAGWQLPVSGKVRDTILENSYILVNENKSFARLFESYGWKWDNRGFVSTTLDGGSGYNIFEKPFYFVRNGVPYDNSSSIVNVGFEGRCWSSTAASHYEAYFLNFASQVNPANTIGRGYGYSVRCVNAGEPSTDNNVEIAVNPTISIDVAEEVTVEKIENNPSTADLEVKVSSNQPYTVAISSNDPMMRSSTASVAIPAKGGLLNTAENGWGIKLKESSEFMAVTNDLQTFYTASGAEVKTIPFTIGISTSPDIPNGEYSTDITVTATQN